MAQPIANVNGKDVFSDKDIRSISGTRIDFSDGSWCDVSTGQVHNNGKGYINIGAPPDGNSATETITKGPISYRMQPLEVRNLFADVDISIHTSDNIQTTITGPKDEIEDIVFSEQGGRLVIEGKGGRSGGTNINSNNVRSTIVTNSFHSVFSSLFGGGNRSTVIINSSSSPTKVAIKIPAGFPVTVNGIKGDTKIGDINAPLTVDVDGQGDVNAGKVTSADLNVKGQGDIEINEATGPIDVKVSGQGGVVVNSGYVPMVRATISGQGDIKLKVRAKDADLSVSGMGDIYVEYVENKPIRKVSGMGDIEIGNR